MGQFLSVEKKRIVRLSMWVIVDSFKYAIFGLCMIKFCTRMHSSRMRTVRCSGRLSCHTCTPSPCMPPYTTHAPLCHACPPLPHTHPMDRMTDACENITFPQLLLRTVKIWQYQPNVGSLRGTLHVYCLCIYCNGKRSGHKALRQIFAFATERNLLDPKPRSKHLSKTRLITPS